MNAKNILSCEYCGNELKRQLIGSNVFYYCHLCGRITSAKDMLTVRTNDDEVEACV